GSAYATANLATGTLALKVTSTTPDHSSQSGMGLASIHITDHLTFKLDPTVSVADIKFSMRVDGFPSCQDASSNCFTNAVIRLGEASDQALGLPLPEPKVLDVTVTVVDGQELPIEAFLSARVEMNNLIDVSDPSASIRLTLPQGVSFSSESGVFLGLQPPPDEPSPRAPVSSDLNGDGKADIVWRNVRTGEVAVWLMDGGLIGSSGFLGGVSSDWQIVGVGDVNSDGMADIVWRNTLSGAVGVWFLNGLTIMSASFPGSASLDWVIKEIGDMDGNGSADFIWHNKQTGAVAVWFMDGPSISRFRSLPGVPLAWQIVGVGDVNADGLADIMWRHAGGVSAVWMMNESTIASVGFFGGTSSEWEIAGHGDLNGNGMTDMVWRNTRTGKVGIWLMNGGAIDVSGFLAGMSPEWRIAQVGDADGDGKADVIWHNRSTGQVAVWLMDGLTLISTEFPGST
ncbi:MAG: VCBS repeat-containing protein, partial [Nitrospira sp.]|nr:VCBS repeat-containing protein [Nitrospira sp.]